MVTDFAKGVVANPNLVLKPASDESVRDKQVVYTMVPDFVRIMEEWQEGPGREEQWIGTLKTFFPLHQEDELSYLKTQWGSPKLIFQCNIAGYNPESEPKIIVRVYASCC